VDRIKAEGDHVIERYLYCPDCGQKKVYFKEKRDRQTRRAVNSFRCKGCHWYAFTSRPNSVDKGNLELLEHRNPELRRAS